MATRKTVFERLLLCPYRRSALLLLAACVATGARAAERVTLRSGFTLTCVEHQQIAPETVRLYMGTGSTSSEANYLDIALASVLSIEEDGTAKQSAEITSQHAVGRTPAAEESGWNTLLEQSGASHNVSAALLASVVQAESAGHSRAVSRSGARGLMQLMPTTAAELGVRDSFAPAENVDGGSAYLSRLLTRYHDDVALTLAAYNAGPAAVDRYHGVPPFRETRLYVARVIREFNRLAHREVSPANTDAAVPLPGTSQ